MSNEKVIIISGGSRGLGLSIVKHFLAQSGSTIVTFSRTCGQELAGLVKTYSKHGRLSFVAVDICDAVGIKQFVDDVFSSYGRIDVLVNNAGTAGSGLLATFTDDEIDRLIDLNLKGTLRLTRAVCRYMILQRSGRVVNISSIVGNCGYSGLTVYSATKAAVDGFTRSLARELGPRGVTVNSIAPGFLRTEMTHGLDEKQLRQIQRRTPLGRLGLPGDVVALVKFLAGDDASFITGQTFVVDGGITA